MPRTRAQGQSDDEAQVDEPMLTMAPDQFATLMQSLQESQAQIFARLTSEVRTSTPNAEVSMRMPAANFTKCTARFSGNHAEVDGFIDAVEVYKNCLQIPDDNAIKGLSMLLTDSAAIWWQGIKSSTASWEDAVTRLRSAFGERRPPFRIYLDLFSYKQGTDPTDLFVSKCRALLSKLPKDELSEKVQLDMVYGLLDRRIRKRLDRDSVWSFDNLLQRARTIEESLQDGDKKPPPPPTSRDASLRPVGAAAASSPSASASTHDKDSRRVSCTYCKKWGHDKLNCKKLKSASSDNDNNNESAKSVSKNIQCYGCGAPNVIKSKCEKCKVNSQSAFYSVALPCKQNKSRSKVPASRDRDIKLDECAATGLITAPVGPRASLAPCEPQPLPPPAAPQTLGERGRRGDSRRRPATERDNAAAAAVARRATMSSTAPPVHFERQSGSEITYSLLNEHAPLFEDMLTDLEQNVDKIKFSNYGLVATTLEDVFLSLGADVAPVNSVSEDGTATIDSTVDGDSLERLTSIGTGEASGLKLVGQHVIAVWMKLALVWMRSWGMVLLQLCVPVLLMNMTLLVTHYVLSFVDGISPRNLTLAEGFARTETLLTYNGTSFSALGALAKSAYEYIFENAGISSMALTLVNNTNIEDYYMERASDTLAMGTLRHTMLIGATFEEDSAIAHFSNFGYHDVATSLAAVHSALLQAKDPAAQIHVFNQPLEATYSEQNDLQMMVMLLSMQLANGIGSSVAIVSAVFVMFYIRERACGAKLLQKAAGLQPSVLWLSSAVFDWLWFLVICISILVSCIAFDVMGLSSGAELGRLYLVIMVYGAAMLPLNYLFSLFFNGPAIGFVVVFFINTIFGTLGPQIVEALAAPQLDTKAASDILDSILQIFPLYSFVTAVRWLNQVEMTVHSCMQLCEYMEAAVPGLDTCTMDTMCETLPTACCVRADAHFEWAEPGILRYLIMMIISCIVLWGVLMIIEYRLLKRLFTRKTTPPPIDENTLDEDVAVEKRHAESVEKPQLADHGLVSRGLSKYYGKYLAVDQLSFTVNDSECFGLLGVNGAGKTSTFKMLMGDETISSGTAHVAGHSVETQLTRVHENIGYCPQFDALFSELTGRETLRYFSMLRGMRPRAADLHAAALATSLGFLPHLDKRVHQYSGGTKRKLNTAVAFLGRTRLVFVDEPTTGVDPAAKRHVWRAVRGVQRSGRGVVLTSHSMEECEALCSRLTIMVNGRFQCFGSPQHLKNKFSEGYTLTIKMKIDEHNRNLVESPVTRAIKDYVNSKFANPRIMEEYQGVLTYYLPDKSMLWSKMFGVMERAKRDLDVEYYSISQTTLEQIFLQFTKYQH